VCGFFATVLITAIDLRVCGMSIAMSRFKDRRSLAADEGTFSNQDEPRGRHLQWAARPEPVPNL
jgi:hypothetical protein